MLRSSSSSAENHPSPQEHPAFGTKAASQFLNCVALLVQQAVSEGLKQNITPASAAETEVGGKALAREVTGLSYSRIYALVSERSLPHMKRGNRLFFSRAELVAWVAEGKRAERKKAR